MWTRVISSATVLLFAWMPAPSAKDAADSERLDEALLSATFVVVGKIHAAEKKSIEWARSQGGPQSGESGHADLTVIETLWGPITSGAEIRIAWNYIDGVDAESSRNPHRDGDSTIYFLTCAAGVGNDLHAPQQCLSGEGALTEQFHMPVGARETVVARLAHYPVGVSGEPKHRVGGTVPITLTLTNPGETPLELPAVRYEAGRMVHGPGVEFSVRQGSRDGETAMLRIGRLRTDSSLERIRLEPGETESFVVDLQKLYGLMKPGFYVLEIELDGLPPQRPFVFRLE